MDSVFTKITNAPQMTAVKQIDYDDIDGASSGTYTRVFYIPKKAKLTKLCILTNTQFVNGSGTTTFKVDHPAGVSQSDGSTAVSAADIIAAADLEALTVGVSDHNLKFTQPPLVNDTSALSNSDVTSYSTSGEYDVVPVTVTFEVGTAAPTAGDMHYWLEFAFDANIVWNQDSLT